jgi:hypothetical protein
VYTRCGVEYACDNVYHMSSVCGCSQDIHRLGCFYAWLFPSHFEQNLVLWSLIDYAYSLHTKLSGAAQCIQGDGCVLVSSIAIATVAAAWIVAQGHHYASYQLVH